MDVLLNRKKGKEKEEEKLNQKELEQKYKLVLKFRRQLIKLAAKAPKDVREFCTNPKNFDKNQIKELKEKIANNEDIKKFIIEYQTFWMFKITDEELEYPKIFKYLFPTDKIYQKKGERLAKVLNYFSFEYLYIVINYIEDNFPVKFKREFTQKEKRLIKYLLFYSDEDVYAKKYNINEEEIELTIKNIYENVGKKTIDEALNIVLIEKYFREENTNFLRTIKSIR